jgi:hypothetical protein
VIEIVEQGYLLNEKVIRFAKVIVGNWGSKLEVGDSKFNELWSNPLTI